MQTTPISKLLDQEEKVAELLAAYRNNGTIEFYFQTVTVVAHKFWTKKNGRPSYAFNLSNKSLIIIDL